MPGPITFAVVGLGRIGWRHAVLATCTAGLKLAGVYDVDGDVRARAERELGTRSYGSYPALLRQCGADVLVVATPSHLHAPMTIRAFAHGLNVLCEKPVARTAAEVRKMMAAARKAGRWLTVNQSVRYQGDVLALKGAIGRGKLGDVYQLYHGIHSFSERKDWQIWRRYNGGAVSNWGVHMVDSLLQLTNARPKQVFAKFNRVLDRGDAEDSFKILIGFDTGLLAEAEILKAAHGKPWWLACGDVGTMRIEHPTPVAQISLTKRSGKTRTRQIDFGKEAENVVFHYRDLSRRLRRGEPPPVSADSVLRQMRVIDAARKSNRSGRSVRVD